MKTKIKNAHTNKHIQQQKYKNTTDMKSAFLQGKELKQDVYLKPPKGSNTPNGIIWKLKQHKNII
jgi:hypothetical protein